MASKSDKWLEFFKKFKDIELPTCKYCHRCVLVGICCSKKAEEHGIDWEEYLEKFKKASNHSNI